MDELAALGISQALYNAVKEAVSTSTPGNVRDAANRRLREAFDATGGAVRTLNLTINGETVGALSASAVEGYKTTDWDAFLAWELERGYTSECDDFDFTALSDDEYRELKEWALSRWPDKVTRTRRCEEDWRDHVGHVGEDVIDEDGEIVPGVKWSTECGTIRITGCQMWPDPRKRSSKYAPVGEVLARAGLDAGQALKMIGGGDGL